MNADKVVETPLGIDPRDYRAGGRGSLDDLFHPQARYLSIQRVERTLQAGPDAGQTIPVLLVEGVRPRCLNLGVKRFVMAVAANRRRADLTPEQEQERIAALQAFLLR